MDWPREVHTEKAVLQVSWAQRSLFSGPLKECTGNGSGQRDWYYEAVQGDGRMQKAGTCYTASYIYEEELAYRWCKMLYLDHIISMPWESLILTSSVILKDWKIPKSASFVSCFNSLYLKHFLEKFPSCFTTGSKKKPGSTFGCLDGNPLR